MSRLKLLRSGVTNVFKLTRNPKGSIKTSSAVPPNVALTRYVSEAEGVIPISTRTLLSRLLSKEDFLYSRERQQVASLASAVDALLFRKNYSELQELKVTCVPRCTDVFLCYLFNRSVMIWLSLKRRLPMISLQTEKYY